MGKRPQRSGEAHLDDIQVESGQGPGHREQKLLGLSVAGGPRACRLLPRWHRTAGKCSGEGGEVGDQIQGGSAFLHDVVQKCCCFWAGVCVSLGHSVSWRSDGEALK